MTGEASGEARGSEQSRSAIPYPHLALRRGQAKSGDYEGNHQHGEDQDVMQGNVSSSAALPPNPTTRLGAEHDSVRGLVTRPFDLNFGYAPPDVHQS